VVQRIEQGTAGKNCGKQCDVAVATGYLYAVVTGGELVFDTDLIVDTLDRRVVLVSFVSVLMLGTLGLFYTFQRRNKSHIRTDLSIVSVSATADGDKTVIIRNKSDSPLDLWEAKVEDSVGKYYHLSVQPRLRPGDKATFDLPSTFSLETVDDVPRRIGPFYRGKKVNSIYSRDGDTFVPEWHDVPSKDYS
jgi:hypothetical protein